MTTKEVAEKFDLAERKVQKLAKAGKIVGAEKINGVYVMPDDVFIITDEMARAFLLKILRLKNNPNDVLSTNDLIDRGNVRIWHTYMQKQGFVGDCDYSDDPHQLMERMQLTDKGWTFVLGSKTFSLLKIENLNINLQISALGITAGGIVA